MDAITLYMPEALFVSLSWKTIETRTHHRFKGLVGKRIAIHAAKKKMDDASIKALFAARDMRKLSLMDVMNLAQYADLCRGKIMCTAEVVNADWWEKCQHLDNLTLRAMCDPTGKFLLFFDLIQALPRPIPIQHGGRGIFKVPDSLIEQG